MKTSRFRSYLDQKSKDKTNPISKKEDVKKSSDKHINQDFNGQAKEDLINPKTAQQKKTAATEVKDGEKILDRDKKDPTKGEEDSDGSGGAFEGTESVKD